MTRANHDASLLSDQEALLADLLDKSDLLFVKKLSVNDRDWARLSNKHQAGVYVPPQERDSTFFPPLIAKAREDEGASEIRESFFDLSWPTIGETRQARLVHYTSKGAETHLTRLPKAAFCDLSPASFLIIGRKNGAYEAITVDSESDGYDLVSELLSLPIDFRSGIFHPAEVKQVREEKAWSFIEEAVRAYFAGDIANFSAAHSDMPTTAILAANARRRYMDQNSLTTLDPFNMDRPGDALRSISRGMEYEIFREMQDRAKSLELIRIILGDNPKASTTESALRSIVLNYPKIDALLLSAAQQRKSRAGYSFEHHIEAMLLDGGVPFDKQVVLESKKRPDFILPSKVLYMDPTRNQNEALVLSAKTTLRERWKQVSQEMRDCDLYLATVDESIASSAIADMASQGIRLVVPESLKNSDTTEYKRHASVLSFKSFFSEEIADIRWPLWKERGLVGSRPLS